MLTNLLKKIGDTPILEVGEKLEGINSQIYAKLEMFNPGGSVKDRIALSMIETAEQKGVLKAGTTILEPTSGNTGIGLAIVSAVKGYDLILTMPESMSEERRSLLKALGAELILTSADKGMNGAVTKAQKLKEEQPDKYFIPQQFNNHSNPEMHRNTTAKVLGVGTGGTITGVGEELKHHNPSIKIYAVEPEKSPVLSGGDPGPHKIQGIGAGFIPEVLNRELIDEVITVSDQKAYDQSAELAKKYGVLVGFSSGAAMYGAVQVARGYSENSKIVTLFPDTGERYLSMFSQFQIDE